MREIKFRAWNRHNEKFRYFDLFEINKGLLCSIDEEDDIPQQYTGIKDKNGVEICEGDIVLWEQGWMYPEMNGEIQWIENGYHFVQPEHNVEWLMTRPLLSNARRWLKPAKIIGNVFEGVDK